MRIATIILIVLIVIQITMAAVTGHMSLFNAIAGWVLLGISQVTILLLISMLKERV